MSEQWVFRPYYLYDVSQGHYYERGRTDFCKETCTANTYRAGVIWTMSGDLCKLTVI